MLSNISGYNATSYIPSSHIVSKQRSTSKEAVCYAHQTFTTNKLRQALLLFIEANE